MENTKKFTLADLIKAIEKKNENKIEEILSTEKDLFRGKSGKLGVLNDGTIFNLIETKDEEFIEKILPKLLENGANINSLSGKHLFNLYTPGHTINSALTLSIFYGFMSVTKKLVELGANINDLHFFNLHTAIDKGDIETVKFLIENDAWSDLSIIDHIKFISNVDIKEYIYKIYLNEKDFFSDKDFEEEVIDCLRREDLFFFNSLKEKFGDKVDTVVKNLSSSEVNELMSYIIRHENIDKLKGLLDSGLDIELNYECSNGNFSYDGTALWQSVFYRKRELVKFLIEQSANVNAVNDFDVSCLSMSVFQNNEKPNAPRADIEITKMLLAKNPDVMKQSNDFKVTALLRAVNYINEDATKLLLELDKDIDYTDTNGNNALSHAINRKNTVILNAVLQKNPDLSAMYKGYSIMDYAEKNGNAEIVEMIKKHDNNKNSSKLKL